MSILDRSESRGGYAVRVLAVHTSEGNDAPNVDDAAALRDASWWLGSSHAIADDDPGFLLTPAQGCVPYERAAWTLRSGNRWSENIELIGWAKWTRPEWLARPRLLNNCARWLADRSAARDIPLVKLTPEQYRAGGRGVIGHNDHTVGYSDGTHWDPGPNFPWDVVLDKARAYRNGTSQEDDMPLNDDDLRKVYQAVWFGAPGAPLLPHEFAGNGEWPATTLGAMTARIARDIVAPQVAALRGEIAGLNSALKQVSGGGTVDLKAVADAAKAGAQSALSEGVAVDITVGGQTPPA